MVQSVPGELSMDQTAVLKLLSSSGSPFVSLSSLKQELKWEETRAVNVISQMVIEGLCWVDSQNDGEFSYWFPSMFNECIRSWWYPILKLFVYTYYTYYIILIILRILLKITITI